jgi:hypothetical protein
MKKKSKKKLRKKIILFWAITAMVLFVLSAIWLVSISEQQQLNNGSEQHKSEVVPAR